MAVTIEMERKTRSRVWELAALMGESHEEAIDAAVRERLEREKIRLRFEVRARTRVNVKAPVRRYAERGLRFVGRVSANGATGW